jgi:transcriptional regulator with XRE-family HTH domain
MNEPRGDLKRLASYVIDARIKAGFSTRQDLAAAAGVSARTLGKLETASEPVSPETLARVAEQLGWTPDSPALIAKGREPVPAGKPPRPVTVTGPAAEYPEPSALEREARVLFPGDRGRQLIWMIPEAEPGDHARKLEMLDVLNRRQGGGGDQAGESGKRDSA